MRPEFTVPEVSRKLGPHLGIPCHEDEASIADIPDLRQCSALGATTQEALAEVLEAKPAWIESAEQHGEPVPEPRYRSAIYASG